MTASEHHDPAVVLVYTTFPDETTARRIAGALLDRGLIACANLIPGMTAVFRWNGKVSSETEVAAILKTRAELADKVVAAVEELHPYDVPAALVLPCSGGSAPFCDWIVTETRPETAT